MNHPHRYHQLKLSGLLLAWTAAAALFPDPAAPRVLEFVQQQLDTSLLRARALAVSEDGKHVYVGGSKTLIFERDEATGELAFSDATNGADVIAISPDGRNLYMHDVGALRVLA
ncbi:MAG: lactonase family protein, partial [bacterium]|nr:lactonase family protein [bacterium]